MNKTFQDEKPLLPPPAVHQKRRKQKTQNIIFKVLIVILLTFIAYQQVKLTGAIKKSNKILNDQLENDVLGMSLDSPVILIQDLADPVASVPSMSSMVVEDGSDMNDLFNDVDSDPFELLLAELAASS
jgi:hypothetical protein